MCARRIAKAIPHDRLVEPMSKDAKKTNKGTKNTRWKEQMTSTPLGLPIVQQYTAVKRIMTASQTVFISDPNAQKQVSASELQYEWCTDANVRPCARYSSAFSILCVASSCEWTKPSDVDQMSTIIRETFLALHSSDVLKRFLMR
ncbi:hypothetical protein C8Q76DRAFT_694213 [Earliella scabrosa]|nr:hypothetical protein C8Q76DRAFT_694213 [Earliella scabrosa]